MRVEQRFAATAAGPATAGRRTDATRAFSLTEGAQQARAGTSAATQTGMLAGLDAILTLQGNEDAPQERRRRSVKRGHDLLDGLDRLKAAILGGRVATHELQAIAGRLSDRAESSGDPRLDGLVAEIELRAAVELAKLEALREA
ncbi:flagellar assembly protein fliX [Methylobacterium sp. C25]|uniref:flagellar assembly protein FliX n=1 Tax=Methylobacterium sp. C25 TaxID=2721622 RepID=UPI001F442A79|nr:flagellar assembly protein FliX [Methylobacterium sp. C25]MCE4225686.1 flagellar assembly protein fliX [Methylobacterium sp. C25]